MTKRLEDALKLLSDEQIEEVIRHAETLVKRESADRGEYKMKLDWFGALSHLPEKTGMELQASAMREWEEMIDHKLAK